MKEELEENVQDDNVNLLAALEEEKKKSDEYMERLKRNMAEFDNFKKRTIKEKESIYTNLTSDIVTPFLEIKDNFENAMKSKCEDESFKNGIEMIYNKLSDELNKLGLEEVSYEAFDPLLHEAVMHEEDEKLGEKQITEIFRKGYVLKGKIIRHAMVKVVN